MNRIYKSSTTDENSSKGISKVTEEFNPQEEIIEYKPFYENKYLIYGVILVASALTYYNFNDEIIL